MRLPFETVPEALDAWAAQTPGAPALVAEGRASLTHRGLAQLRSALAGRLNGLGFGRNDRIAIVHPGGPEAAATIVAVYGCATAVPLNPDATLGEFALCFREMRIQALIVAAGFDTPAVAAAVHLDLPVFRVEEDAQAPAGWVSLIGDSDRAPRDPEPVKPDDVAVLLRTSGSTSHSKTVPVLHRQFRAAADNVAGLFELTNADRCLNLMPLFHQHGLSTAMSVPLYAGGSAICMADFDIETFFRWLVDLQPTWYTGSYTFHHSIAAHAGDYKDYIERMALRFARTASGRLEPEIAARLEALLGIPLIQTYACSEASIIAGNPLPPRQRKLGSVGLPIVESVLILGPDGERMACGRAGEVAIRGPNVFDGYENDASANASAFVDGWFRTGDEGYFDADGYLFLTGRIKEMINRGGEKVTPSEVEAA
ncbi:MAG: AMP-binding protein, partial [Alphaproteobacteria bacterium]|nr:AMP-binding protein [Alphaproteobacteria bacterium]